MYMCTCMCIYIYIYIYILFLCMHYECSDFSSCSDMATGLNARSPLFLSPPYGAWF